MMLPKEYKTISNLSGPLMVVEKIEDVSYDELAERYDMDIFTAERRSVSPMVSAGAEGYWRFQRPKLLFRFMKEAPA